MVQIRKRSLVLAGGLLLVLAVASGGVAGALGSTFADVPPSHPFFDEIEWMNANGIAGGYNDGSYRPGAPVSRAAMAAFMARLNDAYYLTDTGSVSATGTSLSNTADCDDGDRAIAGGGRTTSIELYLTDSHPTTSGDGWTVRWEFASGSSSANIQVWALCAPPHLAAG